MNGMIVAGHGVASGRASTCPFPGGSIRMQQPFFLEHGIDLSPYYAGTLNIDLAPLVPSMPAPANRIFDGRLKWLENIEERFILSKVEVKVYGKCHTGLWYYPHPDTKPDHFQPVSVVELLLPWIDGLATGSTIQVCLGNSN